MFRPANAIQPRNLITRAPRIFRGADLIGGISALTLPPLWRAGYRIWAIDNANENEKRHEFYRRFNVTPIPIAHLHTLDTLAAATNHPGAHLVPQMANGNARDGLMATVGIGGMGGKLLVDSYEFERLLDIQRNAVIIDTEGSPEAIHFAVLCGISGAVGAGAVIPVGRKTELMLASLGVPVEMHYYCVGHIAMTGFSEMAPINDACTRAALIDFAISPAPPNVIRHLHFQELPPKGPDAEDIRTRLLLLDHQCLNSIDMLRHLQREAPNHGARCVFGNISFRDTEILQSEPSLIAVRSSIVSQTYSELVRIKDVRPFTGLIKAETWQERTTPLSHSSVDEILDAHWHSPLKIQEDILAPTESHDPKLTLDIQTVGLLDVSTIDHYMARPLESDVDIIQRRLVLEAVEAHLSSSTKRADYQAARLTSLIDAQWGNVKRYSKGAVDAKPPSRRKIIQRLHDLLVELRKFIEARQMHRARLDALRFWLSLTRRELLALNQTIASVTNCLADCLSLLGPSEGEQLAVSKPVSEILPDLLTLPTYSKEVQDTILDSFGAIVTREGLARITNAALPTIDSIAMSVVVGKPDYKSPPLGAKSYIFHGPVLYTLPPIDPDDMKPLASAIKRHDQNAIVFFADSMDCGAAVVRYRFRYFHDVESHFPGILKHDLERALNSEFALLRFPEGTEFLSRLGIVVDPQTKKLRFESRSIVRL